MEQRNSGTRGKDAGAPEENPDKDPKAKKGREARGEEEGKGVALRLLAGSPLPEGGGIRSCLALEIAVICRWCQSHRLYSSRRHLTA